MINQEVADKLSEIADLLEQQGANVFRVNAYRNAAAVVAKLPQAVSDIVARRDIEGLIELPGIGQGIARCIYEYVAMGRMSRLESLKGGSDPISLFESIPGIGSTLAHRIVEQLHIDSLEALEVAAHSHRLDKVPGFTPQKIAMVQVWLTEVLGRPRARLKIQPPVSEPSVALLLDIDKHYRDKVDTGSLATIAPKRFNPKGEAWLPIMHLSKQGWHFTVLFSNTRRAHELKRTRDWVVIYYYDDQHHESQNTVVTETRGSLIGQRVVRGRELECREFYALHQQERSSFL